VLNVRSTAPHQHGASLIELMIGLAILGFLVALGVPSYTQWIQNGQIRSAAESIQQGLQIARSNAVRRNEFVRFNLTAPGAGGADWRVGCVTVTATCENNIQSWSSVEGAANVRVGANAVAPGAGLYSTALGAGSGVPGVVTFNGTGRVANVGTDITRVDVLNPKLSATDQRRLVIIITAGGSIRMCDPQAAAGVAWACP
jgi:type IV fimbrial biogenesis protein FimT